MKKFLSLLPMFLLLWPLSCQKKSGGGDQAAIVDELAETEEGQEEPGSETSIEEIQPTEEIADPANSEAEVNPDAYLWGSVPMGGGGFVTGLYISAKDPNYMYSKTDVGGAYRYDQENKRWIQLLDHFNFEEEKYYGVGGFAIDPEDPKVVIAALGKYVKSWATPGGIFKSEDAGQTWKKLDLEVYVGGNEVKRTSGERLLIHPADRNRYVFASRRDGLLLSTDAGVSWTKGQNLGAGTEHIGLSTVAVHPTDVNDMIVGVHGEGVFRSKDFGATWTKVEGVTANPFRITFDSTGRYYVAGEVSDTLPTFAKCTAENVCTDITPEVHKQGYSATAINPKNEEEIIVTRNSTYFTQSQTQASAIYHSIDGGSTWKQLNPLKRFTVPWFNESSYFGSYIAGITFDPKQDGRVWFSDWFGVWVTEDVRAAPSQWQMEVSGLEEMVIFDLERTEKTDSGIISGAADQEGFLHISNEVWPNKKMQTQPYGWSWQHNFDISRCLTNPNRMIRTGGNTWNHSYYVAYSDDAGETWDPKWLPQSGENQDGEGVITALRVFMLGEDCNRTLVFDKDGGVYTSDDKGETWTKITTEFSWAPGQYWNWTQPAAQHGTNRDRLFFLNGDKLWITEDKGSTFKLVKEGLESDTFFQMKTAENTAIIGIAMEKKGFLLSQNDGAEFAKVPGITKARLLDLTTDPDGNVSIYILGVHETMGHGLFLSTDLGVTFTNISDPKLGLGNYPTAMRVSKDGTVYVGSNGRGIFYGKKPAAPAEQEVAP